eukprot:6218068-Prymnesium_polylepis.1
MEAGIHQGYFDRNGSIESDTWSWSQVSTVDDSDPARGSLQTLRSVRQSRVQRRHVRQHDY